MRALLAFALTGCSQWFGLDHPELVDASVDTAPPVCLGERDLEICVPRPSMPLVLTGMIDTGACETIVALSGAELCVVVGTNVTVDDARAIGPRPLVVFAVDKLAIESMLDVAAHQELPQPAGAGSAQCGLLLDGTASTTGGGGGAGGSFGTHGGRGGAGAIGAAPGANISPEVAPPSGLRGGCTGSQGGAGSSAQVRPPGGGGGAVYLVAGTSITIAAVVNASGGGGVGGGGNRTGGSGGGSGGLIALWSPSITVTGELIANGGGGGGGADEGALGITGQDPTSADGVALGGGGGGASSCGAGPGCGGNGAYKAGPGGDGLADTTNAGGGGGGGGLGFIRVVSRQPITGLISPLPILD